jgi:hypothetical protein
VAGHDKGREINVEGLKYKLFRALDYGHDPGLIEPGCAQFEETVGRVPPEYARGLIVSVPDILGDDGVRNAQLRLPAGASPC